MEAAFAFQCCAMCKRHALYTHSLPPLPTSIMRRVFRLIAMETTQAATENAMAQRDSGV
jgi:hypothetical protein